MTKKRPLVIGNWKMNKSIKESVDIVQALRSEPLCVDAIKNVDILITPSYIALTDVKEACRGSVMLLGGQDVFYIQTGAYCGAVSPRMLSEVCGYAFVGHSERRMYFGETDEIVNKKLLACIEAGITPVFCLGESSEAYGSGKTEEYIMSQLIAGLKGAALPKDIVILYEPVWALGTGKVPEPERVDYIMGLLQKAVFDRYGREAFNKIRFVYAGSINSDNAASYAGLKNVDGLALGTASLYADKFCSIVRTVSDLYMKE